MSGEVGGVRVGGDVPGRQEQARRSVAQAAVDDPLQLFWVVQAADQRLLGHALTVGVGGGLAGELLGSGQSWGAVTPGGAHRPGVLGPPEPGFFAGDRLGPPRAGVVILPPGVQPGADPLDGLRLAVRDDPAPHRQGQQRQRTADPVRHAEVAVPAGKVGRSTAGGGQVGPPAGKILGTEGFGESDEIGQDLPDEVTVRITPQQVCAQARQPVDEIELGERRAVPAVDTPVGLIEAALGDGGDAGVQGGERPLVFSRPVGGSVEGEGQGRCAEEQGGLGTCADVAVGGCCQPGVRHLPAAEPGSRAFDVQQRHSGSASAQGLGMPLAARC